MHQAILAETKNCAGTIARKPLRFICSGLAPLPRRLARELESVFNVPVIEAYGMMKPRTRSPATLCRPVSVNSVRWEWRLDRKYRSWTRLATYYPPELGRSSFAAPMSRRVFRQPSPPKKVFNVVGLEPATKVISTPMDISSSQGG